MNGMMSLARRNVICYFRNAGAVLGSLMAVIIVLLLFLLFLREMLLTQSEAPVEGMGNLIDSWVMAGILGIIPVTTAAGCLQTMIEDRVNGRERDLLVTPMKPRTMAWGYVLSTSMVTVIMSVLAFVISLIYLAATGCPMGTEDILMSALLIVPSSLSGAIIVYAIVSFIKSTTMFSVFNVLVGILIGFLAGVYMPMTRLGTGVQFVGTLLPATQMASLFRLQLCDGVISDIFEGAPQDVVDGFMVDQGITLQLGDFTFTPEMSMLYVVGVTALFFIIAVIGIRKRA